MIASGEDFFIQPRSRGPHHIECCLLYSMTIPSLTCFLFLLNHHLQPRLGAGSLTLQDRPDVLRGLIEEEGHALGAEALADNVELDAVLVDHVCHSARRKNQSASASLEKQHSRGNNCTQYSPPTIVNDLTPSIPIVILRRQLTRGDEP